MWIGPGLLVFCWMEFLNHSAACCQGQAICFFEYADCLPNLAEACTFFLPSREKTLCAKQSPEFVEKYSYSISEHTLCA